MAKSVINTRHILFIVSGAFNGLVDIVRKRIGAKNIGFVGRAEAGPKQDDYLALAKSTDFIEFGFESEFIGRLPVVVSCQELEVADLFDILKHSEGSIVRQYVQAFDAYGIELEFTDEGLHRLAELAYLEKTGARSLVGVFERTFREFKFQLPRSGVRRLRVTAELVDSPESVFEEVLETARADQLVDMEQTVRRISDEWSKRYGIEIVLQAEAARTLGQIAIDSGEPLQAVFNRTFKNYEHGLNLIQKTRGISRFEITPEVIRDPAGTLDRWIRDYYITQPGP